MKGLNSNSTFISLSLLLAFFGFYCSSLKRQNINKEEMIQEIINYCTSSEECLQYYIQFTNDGTLDTVERSILKSKYQKYLDSKESTKNE